MLTSVWRRHRRVTILASVLALTLFAGFATTVGAAAPKQRMINQVINCTPRTDIQGRPTTLPQIIPASCVPNASPMPTKVNGKLVHRVFYFDPTCHPFTSTPAQRNLMTDAQLVSDGLLPRTAFPTLAQWQAITLKASKRVCTSWEDLFPDGSPVNTNAPAHSTQPASPAKPANAGNIYDYRSDWNGYVSLDRFGGVDRSAASGYVWIPCISGWPWSYHAASFWVGQSGYYSDPVLQAGVNVEEWESYNGVYQVFYENTGYSGHSGQQNWIQMPCGYNVYVYVTGNYIYMQESEFGITFSTNWGPVAYADSAEWIGERVSCGYQCLNPLTQWSGHQTFTYCEWEDQNGHWWNIDSYGANTVAEEILTTNGSSSGAQMMNFSTYSLDSGSSLGDTYWNSWLRSS